MAKKDYDKTLTRLIGILTKFSQGEYLDSKELADEYNVTQRTIQKDIYTRLNRFPIEKNNNGKFKFIDGFSLDKSILGTDEMILISLSLSQFNNMKDFTNTSKTILKKLLYPERFNPYFIKQNQLEPINITTMMHNQLINVIKERYITEITFKYKTVTVEPYKLCNFNGLWYLFAKDIKADKIKTYMLSKIKKVKTSNTKHKMSHHQIDAILEDVHSEWFDDSETYKILIKVNKNISHYFKQRNFLKSQKILKEFDNGDLSISFEVTHDEDIDNVIKSWLPDIEVCEPKEYKEQIVSELREYLERVTK